MASQIVTQAGFQGPALRDVLRKHSDAIGKLAAEGAIAHRMSAKNWEALAIIGAVFATAAGVSGFTPFLPKWGVAVLSFVAATITAIAASQGSPAKVTAHVKTGASYNQLAHAVHDFQVYLTISTISDQKVFYEWKKLCKAPRHCDRRSYDHLSVVSSPGPQVAQAQHVAPASDQPRPQALNLWYQRGLVTS